ncbi:major facilitator superfamily protein [Artemisia annua]|uniref:Major facilitator superfamily protein n=1 Tax=Artemisia annua TaxID=35608 RepID=A0A2U1KWV5_ARTAN|nr:major facilitator superfamily protein [Artemisia annua]
MVPQLKPPPCNQLTETCKPTNSQFAFLIFCFIFITIGAGASSLYFKSKVKKSISLALFNSRTHDPGIIFQKKNSTPLKRLRFLNKACMIQNPKDITPEGDHTSNPWHLCTVEQVEELKSLIRVLHIWSSGLIMSINTSQSTFPVLQAKIVDRHLGDQLSKFPQPLSLSTYSLSIISKILKKQIHLGVKLRMGIGIFISRIAVIISAIVEHHRKKKAIEQGLVINMSAMWPIPQYSLHGLGEGFSMIGQCEFYYSEFPKSMSSIAASLSCSGWLWLTCWRVLY